MNVTGPNTRDGGRPPSDLRRPFGSSSRRVLLYVAIALFVLGLAGALLQNPFRSAVLGGEAEQVDPHPLYMMHYYGDADCGSSTSRQQSPVVSHVQETYACTLFSAFGNREHAFAARNFDWESSPALLLFTHPTNGYISVAMVNLGFLRVNLAGVTAQTLPERLNLSEAAALPIDGMNEYGLSVGMAAVPDSQVPRDTGKPTVGSLCAIRLMLDHAKTTDEAIALLQQYNIDFQGGPQIHYLIADPSGRSAVVEYKNGAMHVWRNEQPWQVATNFHLTDSTTATKQACWRYTTASERLEQAKGVLLPQNGMTLLSQVAQSNTDYPTQWSTIYDMSTGDVLIAMSRKYDSIHTFHLALQR